MRLGLQIICCLPFRPVPCACWRWSLQAGGRERKSSSSVSFWDSLDLGSQLSALSYQLLLCLQSLAACIWQGACFAQPGPQLWDTSWLPWLWKYQSSQCSGFCSSYKMAFEIGCLDELLPNPSKMSHPNLDWPDERMIGCDKIFWFLMKFLHSLARMMKKTPSWSQILFHGDATPSLVLHQLFKWSCTEQAPEQESFSSGCDERSASVHPFQSASWTCQSETQGTTLGFRCGMNEWKYNGARQLTNRHRHHLVPLRMLEEESWCWQVLAAGLNQMKQELIL